MGNKINTYGYAVYRGAGNIPLHVVEIKYFMLAGFAVFSNAADAREYIARQKNDLHKYAELKYDPDFIFCDDLLNIYQNAEAGLFTCLVRKEMFIRPDYVINFI